jgi:hypothetical protein
MDFIDIVSLKYTPIGYASVSIIKPQPDSVLGFSSMVIQGAILSFLFANSLFDNGRLMDAVRFAWCFGAFLVSYIALTLRPGAYDKTRR